MDCPKKDCDGQVEAWFKVVNYCGVDDDGEADFIWNDASSEHVFERYQCSQCCAIWIDKPQLLIDIGDKLEREKGEMAEVTEKGGEINR